MMNRRNIVLLAIIAVLWVLIWIQIPAGAVTFLTPLPMYQNYSSKTTSQLAGKANAANPTFAGTVAFGAMSTTSPNGTHYVRPYNSVAFTGTPQEGMIQTTPSGLQVYHNGAWGAVTGTGGGNVAFSNFSAGKVYTNEILVPPSATEGGFAMYESTNNAGDNYVLLKAPASLTTNPTYEFTASGLILEGTTIAPYALPTASAGTIGGIRVGSGLTVDGSGILSATGGSGGGSGQAVSSYASNTTIRNGNLYVGTATAKLTFRNHSTGRTSVFANYSTRLIPDSGSKIFWRHPSTFANYSVSAGYSVKIPAGTWVDIVSYGSPLFQAVMTTQQLVKTGIDEYAGGGGGGGGSISEDFASCSDWTTITGFSGGVVCSGGYGHGATNEADNQAYYSASSTGSPNHWVRVTSVEYPASGRSASLVVRSNGTTFYSIFFYGSTVTVARNDGNWDSSYDGGYTYGVGTFYDVKAEVSGTGASVNIKVYVGNMTTPVLDANDASAGRLTTGDYIGVGFARTSGDDPRVDNLTAGAL